MTKISTIYDAIVTEVETALGSAYKKIPNAYEPKNNNELMMEKAYGIAFDAADDVTDQRELKCNLYLRQAMLIVLVNQIYAHDHDIDGQADAEKSLIEDFVKIAKAIRNNVTLDESLATLHAGHGGVNILQVDRNDPLSPKYYSLEISITTEFREKLS